MSLANTTLAEMLDEVNRDRSTKIRIFSDVAREHEVLSIYEHDGYLAIDITEGQRIEDQD